MEGTDHHEIDLPGQIESVCYSSLFFSLRFLLFTEYCLARIALFFYLHRSRTSSRFAGKLVLAHHVSLSAYQNDITVIDSGMTIMNSLVLEDIYPSRSCGQIQKSCGINELGERT
mmetsp:Transcript_22982/g.74914  ORF Transcript_22982/g.74914 Transcript_22982/m.74914 type:complete len:115 (-) Transcript_22982:143-487(-)